MVPAADAKMSQKAMDETFLLSNVAPQVGEGFNRHCPFSLSFSSFATHSRTNCRLGLRRSLRSEGVV